MEEVNKNAKFNDTDKKLHISDVSCSVCGWGIKHTIGHSFTWTGIYDIQRCNCKTRVVKKQATGNMNKPEDKYMVNEFGRIKRTLLNRLKIMVNRQVRHKQ